MSALLDLTPALTRPGRLALLAVWAPGVLQLFGDEFNFLNWPGITLASAFGALWLFLFTQYMGERYSSDFWYLHGVAANVGIYIAYGDMPGTMTWPLLGMAAVSFLLWLHMRPAYIDSRRSYRRLGVVTAAGEAPPIHAAPVHYHAMPSKLSFASIVGMEAFKVRLGQAVTEIMENFKDRGSNGERNGILLFGEPGNGKTLFANALAGEMQLPILTVTFADVASHWTGLTTERLQQVFNDAERQAPCVLFFDEIDSLLIRRDQTASSEAESPKTTNAIMTRLVDIRARGVVIIAATNYLERLDPAAIRDGRFDYMIEVPPPDYPARLMLLRRELKAGGVTWDDAALQSAARRYEDFSAARVRGIARDAVDLCKAGPAGQQVTAALLQQALRNRQGTMGVRLDDRVPDLDEVMLTPAARLLIEGIATRMREPEATERLGGTAPTGLLFHGPSGTGKTLTVKSLARATGWALLATSGQDLQARFEAIDEILERAADLRPCIIFIDEADDVLGERRLNPATRAITDKILTSMDGAEGRSPDVVWIAATNHPESIDKAALRAGRFTEKVHFELPDLAMRTFFAERWLSQSRAHFDTVLTPERIAALVGDISYANLEGILQAAVNHRVSRQDENRTLVIEADLRFAIQTVLGQT